MRKQGMPYDDAVSPVVGVMLMLVVTIIIAAVVSAFSGGLVSGQEKAPTASFDVRIKNTGEGATSSFYMKCLGVSDPIPTKNVKIVTSWTNKNGISGGATILPVSPKPGNVWSNGTNTHYHSITLTHPWFNAPRGTGPGIDWGTTTTGNVKPEQDFGNYTWVAGVTTQHWPQNWYGGTVPADACGYGYPNRWQYNVGPCYDPTGALYGDSYQPFKDSLMALLGDKWYELRSGDVVNIKMIHIPSGKMIFEKNVLVEG